MLISTIFVYWICLQQMVPQLSPVVMWGHDLTTEFSLLEANMGFFAKFDKGEF